MSSKVALSLSFTWDTKGRAISNSASSAKLMLAPLMRWRVITHLSLLTWWVYRTSSPYWRSHVLTSWSSSTPPPCSLISSAHMLPSSTASVFSGKTVMLFFFYLLLTYLTMTYTHNAASSTTLCAQNVTPLCTYNSMSMFTPSSWLSKPQLLLLPISLHLQDFPPAPWPWLQMAQVAVVCLSCCPLSALALILLPSWVH